MTVYKFVQGNHGNETLKAFAELWKDRKHCDCTLVVDHFRIQLHKLVILAAWPSVVTSFSVMEDNGLIEIYLPDFISPDALSDFVSYLYNGEIKITQDNFDSLESIADALSNNTLSQICKDYRQSCMCEDQPQQKNLSRIITKLSERHRHNLDLLNKVKNPALSTRFKRNSDFYEDPANLKKKKTDTTELSSERTAEDASRKSEVINKSQGEESPQNVSIKIEPTNDEDGSDNVPESEIDTATQPPESDSFGFGLDRKDNHNLSFGENSQEDLLNESENNSDSSFSSPKVNKRIGKKYRNYTQEMLTAAFNDVKSGKHSVLRAAKIYGVPEETLRDKIKGRRKLDCTQGRSHCFSEEEEYKILDTLEFYGKYGYKYKGVDIMRIATRYAIDFRKSIGQEDDTDDPAYTPRSQRGQKIHNRSIRGLKLTRKWFDGFYQRWSERIDPYIIVPNKTGKVTETPKFSENTLKDFYRIFEQTLSDYNLSDKPENIFFVEDLRLLNLVLGPRDEKLQKSVSIAAVANLAGCAFPPYFVKEAIDSDAESYFEEITGIINGSEVRTLQDHLLTCMLTTDDTSHRLLLINGDKMFVCIGIEEWAHKNNIILLIVPENVALYLRPFDFASEGNFQKRVDQSYEISLDLSAAENYQLFKSLVEMQFTSTFTQDRLRDTFSKIGVFPPSVSIAVAVCSKTSVPVKMLLHCEECEKFFSSTSNFRKHMEIHGPTKECGCGAKFSTKEQLTRHRRSKHLGGFECKPCKRLFSSRNALRCHINMLHAGSEELKCTVCGKQFGQKSHLKEHASVHSNETAYTCETCGKMFKFRRSYQRHKVTCSVERKEKKTNSKQPERMAQCSKCGKVFSRERYLRQHLQTHGDHKRQCQRCGKTFVFKSSIGRHLSRCRN